MSSYTHPSIPSDYDVEDAFSSTSAPNYTPTSPDYSRDFFPPEDISPPKDTETHVESPILSIFAELDNSLWIISRPLGSEPVPEEPNEMPPKRMSTSEAPAMTQATIKKLVIDSVSAAMEAQAANMAKLIIPPDQEKLLFSCNNCTEDFNVKFATGTLTEEALSRWNSFAQPIGIEEAYKITWVEFKKLLIKKYYPRTKVQKMENEFYHLIVKGNDLKTYVRRFQELATLCPTMVPDSEKMMEVCIGGLP
ncbi:reverse transcriptase domain-containing protein [Tanacetum coccineum]